MKINHLDLQVADVKESVALFERLLGLTLESNRASPAIAILGDGEGFTLVLQKRKSDEERYPEGFHFGSLVADVDRVHAFHAAARAEGLEVSPVIENGRGTLVYARTPDGLLIEVSHHRPRAPVA